MTSDLLRRAAAKVREVAEGARAGRWYAAGNEVLAAWNTPRPVALCEGSPVTEGNSLNANHIALWHPSVALAVADWLDSVADEVDMLGGFSEADAAGLAVARLLLGEATDE